MDKQEMRRLRRMAIEGHIWMAERGYPWQFETDNLRLCVRLYELQFYGQELKAYK